tara:strand:- start:315 stop:755 length:441 start_codon:yes stop_codon:yes gene_type:complete
MEANAVRPRPVSPGRTPGLMKCAALVASCALLAACAGMGSPKTPEEIVAQRAQARLDLLLAGNLEKSMNYTTPAYRTGLGITSYTRRHAGTSSWNKAEVSSVTCESDRCEVAIEVTYQTFGAGFENTRSREERWIKVDGSWYVYLK